MNLTIDVARRILEASKQRANELRSPVSIAIVDAGGHLVLFERMMSPYGWATGNISIAKATTAVMFNQSTDAVAQWGSGIPGFASSLAAMTQGKFVMAAGGWPIRVAGGTIGGIGVSGGNAPGRDDDIARAGIAAAEAWASAAPQMQPSQPMQAVQPALAVGRTFDPPSVQPTPSYPAMAPLPSQAQQPQNVAASSYLGADQERSYGQENPYGDEPSSSDQFNENSGGQS